MSLDDPEEFADQDLAEFVRRLGGQPPMSSVGDPNVLRRQTDERSAERPRGPDMHTTDLTLDGSGLGMRLYQPTDSLTTLIVFLHGGGWTIGDLDSHDRACRRLADRSRAAVLALDYRRAPEFPAPAAVDDVVSALEWLNSGPAALNGRPVAVALAGDSAGGTLAALAALRERHQPSAPDVLALVYANTDLAADRGSMQTHAHGFGLDVNDIRWFNSLWVPDRTQWSDPAVSPLKAPALSGLPETLVVTCALDPLRDQGEEFAGRLRDSGVLTTHRREPGMVHNFLLWDLISPSCSAASDRLADDLGAALRRHSRQT